tara:strand:- start:11383 stop:12255 length:873 start_codon:yes stop_codon:yes gene_type:complete
MYTFVTSLNKEYWESTSKVNLQSWCEHLPPEVKIVLYSEDYIDVGSVHPRIIYKNLYDAAPELVAFKERHKDNPHYNGKVGHKQEGTTKAFKWRGIKFAHKTFAIFSEARIQDTGWLTWLDADVLMHTEMTTEFLEKLFPKHKSISYLGRPGEYDECGLMGYNLNHEFTREFLTKFENQYLNGLDHLRETHDSWVFFQLRLSYEDQNPFWDLNPNPINSKSPFNNSGINQVMVHTKGNSKERIQQKFLKRFALEEKRKDRQKLMTEFLEETIPLADATRNHTTISTPKED